MGRGSTRLLIILLAVPSLAGCFRSSTPPQFYMLTASATSGKRATANEAAPLIGLGPVRIPGYLDRDQIVTAVSGQEFKLSDNHRWAERLDVTLTRVSVENLSAMIPSDRIVIHPWPREPAPDIQVSIDIQDLYIDPTAMARFSALWSLRDIDGTRTNRNFTCRQPASLTDYSLMVEAQSRCLGRLNQAIADSVREAAARRVR
jgi:uncharacterized lipoprotein YmbA